MNKPKLQTTPPASTADVRTGMTSADILHDFRDQLAYEQARFAEVATRNDQYMALAYAVRDRLLQRWIKTMQTYLDRKSRTVCYLSAEFLMGPQLGNNLVNLGIYEDARAAMEEAGLDLAELLEHEGEPGLGNGGLGRLAAGTELIVDYMVPDHLRDPDGRIYVELVAPVAAQRGEPWRTFFTPADLSGLLDAYGLATVEHARQHEMVDPVLWERTDALRPSTLTRIVRARVAPG